MPVVQDDTFVTFSTPLKHCTSQIPLPNSGAICGYRLLTSQVTEWILLWPTKTGVFGLSCGHTSALVCPRLIAGTTPALEPRVVRMASDFVIILNQRRAVEAFSKGGNLTFGGNCTVAVGPLGRNLEADVALRSTAAVYSYCKSRGLYAGVSIVGSCILERKDTNRKFYSQDIRASAILNGDVEPPPEAYDLYTILEDYTEKYTSEWQSKNMRPTTTSRMSAAPSRPKPPSLRAPPSEGVYQPRPTFTRKPPSFEETKPTIYPSLSSWPMESPGQASGGPLMVTAIHAFSGQQPGDLSFGVGDRIKVLTKTDAQYDWWEGELRGQVGIFPANFVSYN
ncbi:SH3 domain-containing YSC84-like protein 1 isoform X2 [Brachyhypopomus gauderio]|uniref:SH3 domain-containing YSC84-like protein 1 isoform X2 n=1 Tax=Brachyhypopomus gauderio TaxID=698409 RepID=UPI0040433CC8